MLPVALLAGDRLKLHGSMKDIILATPFKAIKKSRMVPHLDIFGDSRSNGTGEADREDWSE